MSKTKHISCFPSREILEKIEYKCVQFVNKAEIESSSIDLGKLVRNQVKQNLVDEMVWIQNRKIIGEDGISAVGEMGFLAIDDCLQNLDRVELRELGNDDFVSVYRKIT